MSKPSIADVIAVVLGGECRARCMDDEHDREVTIKLLREALRETLYDWIEEIVECVAVCNLNCKERRTYLKEMVAEALKETE